MSLVVAEAPSCACLCLCVTLLCPVLLHLTLPTSLLADALPLLLFLDGCFAVVVASLLLSRYFAAESVLATSCCGGFAVGVVFFADGLWIPGGCFAAFGSRPPSLVDAFAPESVLARFLADALPPWSLGL